MDNSIEQGLAVPEQTAIQQMIIEIRGVRVMLDSDLAKLYQVETKYLKRQVKRNITRFPEDFMFELTEDETRCLRCQNVTPNKRGGNRYRPFVFTELGVAMLSSILTSEVAVQINIAIMRAFSAMKDQISKQMRIDSEIETLKVKMDLLMQQREYDLESMNNLSEDVRNEIDMINRAIAELSLSVKGKRSSSGKRIGFKQGTGTRKSEESSG